MSIIISSLQELHVAEQMHNPSSTLVCSLILRGKLMVDTTFSSQVPITLLQRIQKFEKKAYQCNEER